MLHAVQGVRVALDAAPAKLKQRLVDVFVDLGGEFAEFGWMVEDVRQAITALQRDQAHQLALSRSSLQLQYEGLLLLRRQGQQLDQLAARSLDPTEVMPPAPPGSAAEVVGTDGAVCPYMGLRPFEVEDQDRFFGRERLMAELLVRLTEANLLAVVGPSGCGKSSVLRAGLLPALADGRLPAWSGQSVLLTPGADPIHQIAGPVALACGLPSADLASELTRNPGRASRKVHDALTDRGKGRGLALVIDQFEELFTLCQHKPQRVQFVQALRALADLG